MAKDTNDNSTVDAFPPKRGRGRPRKAEALTGADRTRIWREKQASKPRPSDLSTAADALSAAAGRISALTQEVDLLTLERNKAFSAVRILTDRLAAAGLSTDYRG